MNNKGFTLIELLVVVLIIGILAAMAMPQYFKAVERSRMSEAVTLLGNIAQAQQRKYLQINKYAANYTGLDVAPKGASLNKYYTKGDPATGKGGNGFEVVLSAAVTYADGNAVATRVSKNSTGADSGVLQYDYTLTRYYASNGVTCTAKNANGASLCNDFCGIDTLTAANESCCSGAEAGSNGQCKVPVAND